MAQGSGMETGLLVSQRGEKLPRIA
jgi:hypothetical protein